MNHLPISSSFPTRVYYGISILIEPKITRNNPVLKMFSMDFDEIYSRFCLSDCCHIYRENEQIDHIFDEMYQCVPYVKIEYFRFKVLELFYFIKTMSITYQTDETYYAKEQVDKVKHIRNQLVSHTERRIKLNDLVSAHDISMTVFKSCFKSIYGETPYAYVKKYKMSQAANMLVEESININEIALALSYKNASKFSEAFQSVMGLSPKEYRVKNRVVKRK
jgi:AraC-like DNA-binding protein